jgi:uncharacterized protein (DUF2249 family)
MPSDLSATGPEPEPILATWKISEVLRQYPQLLDTLVDLTPAFAKLRNPILRKVQTRLVTVTQAAGIAGIEPAQLVRQLNRAAGIAPPDDPSDSPTATPRAASTPPDWFGTSQIAATLDVRPLLARGEEPFKTIMDAARTIPAGSTLRLIAPFEPVPLFDALAKQGFTHWSSQLDSNTWQVDFHRSHDRAKNSVAPAPVTIDWDAPAAEITIDVSELVPPEPMVKILQTLETLPPATRLLVHHVRRPIHLYDRLDEMGYAHATRDLAPGQVQVMIQKPSASGGLS